MSETMLNRQESINVMKIAIKDIVFRKDLYPRLEPDNELIEKYTQCIDELPPIELNQDNKLIDGNHL